MDVILTIVVIILFLMIRKMKKTYLKEIDKVISVMEGQEKLINALNNKLNMVVKILNCNEIKQ